MTDNMDLMNSAFRVVLRDRLETDLLAFVCYFHREMEGEDFIVGDHHRIIVDELLAMYQGRLPEDKQHLMINMPPRYGKTQLMIYFVAWLFAKHPKQKVMHLSCSDALVIENSKKILKVLRNEKYQALWPTSFERELENDWALNAGGQFYAASTGGQVIGKGCGLTTTGEWGGFMWIDDPLKPADANSDTVRGNVNALCGWAVRTRRNSRETPCVMVMQRLHDQDTTGFIMGGQTAKQWRMLSLPALKDGKALWPYKHTVEELQIERMNDKWLFAAQYQQDPVPEDGEYFSEADARYYSKLPEGLNYYISSDIALSEGKGDFTEHAVFGVDAKDNIYIVDWWSGQVNDVDVVESLVGLVKRWRPKFIVNEAGPTWKAIEGSLTRALRDAKCYVSMEVVSAVGKKDEKARAIQGLWRHNMVYIPTRLQWADELLGQMKRFPKGKFDDKVDALANFGRIRDKVGKNHHVRKGAEETGDENVMYLSGHGRQSNKAGGWMGV